MIIHFIKKSLNDNSLKLALEYLNKDDLLILSADSVYAIIDPNFKDKLIKIKKQVKLIDSDCLSRGLDTSDYSLISIDDYILLIATNISNYNEDNKINSKVISW